jgi:hypothetical protein
MAKKLKATVETKNEIQEIKNSPEIEIIKARLDEKGEPPKCKIKDNHLQMDENNSLKMSVAFGYLRPNTAFHMLQNLAQTEKLPAEIEKRSSILNRYQSIMYGMKPQDEIEAMLMSQMVAIYELSMKTCNKLANCEYLETYDSFSTAANKAMRTYAALVEALTKYRTKGQQKVIVEHVTVNDGGQAIVGSITRGG